MKSLRLWMALAFVATLALAAFVSPAVQAQGQTIKIGVNEPLTGAFAASVADELSREEEGTS